MHNRLSILFQSIVKNISSALRNGYYSAEKAKVKKKLLTESKNAAIIHGVNSTGMWLSLVERLLWEQDAAGSSPVIPTIVVASFCGDFSLQEKPTDYLCRFYYFSEQSGYYSIRADIDSFSRRRFRKTGHCHYVACQDNHEPCTCRNLDILYCDGEVFRCAELCRVIGE